MKLIIYDFDNTLIDSPTPETGKEIYKDKTGKDYPHKGWWGKPETLDMNIFDIQPIPNVYNQYLLDRADKDNYMVLATGRLSKVDGMRSMIDKILDKYGIIFDEVHLNYGIETFSFKRKLIDKLLREKKFESLIIYDDRDEHLALFKNWYKTNTDIIDAKTMLCKKIY